MDQLQPTQAIMIKSSPLPVELRVMSAHPFMLFVKTNLRKTVFWSSRCGSAVVNRKWRVGGLLTGVAKNGGRQLTGGHMPGTGPGRV